MLVIGRCGAVDGPCGPRIATWAGTKRGEQRGKSDNQHGHDARVRDPIEHVGYGTVGCGGAVSRQASAFGRRSADGPRTSADGPRSPADGPRTFGDDPRSSPDDRGTPRNGSRRSGNDSRRSRDEPQRPADERRAVLHSRGQGRNVPRTRAGARSVPRATTQCFIHLLEIPFAKVLQRLQRRV
jgi:hypothetical protein